MCVLGWGGIIALKLKGPWVPEMALFDRCAPGHVSLAAEAGCKRSNVSIIWMVRLNT